MKFLPLVCAGLWRRPVRSVLTAACIVIAFLLFGLLQGINAGFAKAIADAHRDFLVTNTRVRGGGMMPISAMAKIQSIPGVREVAPRAYFRASYRDPSPNKAIAALATVPDLFFRARPGLIIDQKYLDTMRANRTGMLVTPALLEQLEAKIGDTITLRTETLKTDGTRDWVFTIAGTFDTKRAPSRAYFGLINYAYFDEYRVENRGTAETFYIHIADPTKAVATAAAIDQIFANSSHETRTRSDQERAESQAKQLGDVAFFTNAIMGAVLFTLAFLTGNTLRQSMHERLPESAVLKSMGYSDSRVLGIAYAEALLLCIPPAALGLVLAYLVAPLAREDIGAIVVSPEVAMTGVLCAALLALIGVALPALNLSRIPIATSLSRR